MSLLKVSVGLGMWSERVETRIGVVCQSSPLKVMTEVSNSSSSCSARSSLELLRLAVQWGGESGHWSSKNPDRRFLREPDTCIYRRENEGMKF